MTEVAKNTICHWYEDGQRTWRQPARDWLRLLHLIGMSAFLGGILSSTTLSLSTPVTQAAQNVEATWNTIGTIASTVTTPGLMLTILTGVGLVVVGRYNPMKQVWLGAKIVLTGLLLANAIVVIVPAEDALRQLASGAAAGSITQLANTARLHQAAGGGNLAIAVLIAALGVFMPRIGRISQSEQVLTS